MNDNTDSDFSEGPGVAMRRSRSDQAVAAADRVNTLIRRMRTERISPAEHEEVRAYFARYTLTPAILLDLIAAVAARDAASQAPVAGPADQAEEPQLRRLLQRWLKGYESAPSAWTSTDRPDPGAAFADRVLRDYFAATAEETRALLQAEPGGAGDRIIR
jgi:hypothetical protein